MERNRFDIRSGSNVYEFTEGRMRLVDFKGRKAEAEPSSGVNVIEEDESVGKEPRGKLESCRIDFFINFEAYCQITNKHDRLKLVHKYLSLSHIMILSGGSRTYDGNS